MGFRFGIGSCIAPREELDTTNFESKAFVFPPFEELVCEWLCLLTVFLPEGEARN